MTGSYAQLCAECNRLAEVRLGDGRQVCRRHMPYNHGGYRMILHSEQAPDLAAPAKCPLCGRTDCVGCMTPSPYADVFAGGQPPSGETIRPLTKAEELLRRHEEMTHASDAFTRGAWIRDAVAYLREIAR